MVDTHEEAWPFQKPVEDWYAPGYYELIKVMKGMKHKVE